MRLFRIISVLLIGLWLQPDGLIVTRSYCQSAAAIPPAFNTNITLTAGQEGWQTNKVNNPDIRSLFLRFNIPRVRGDSLKGDLGKVPWAEAADMGNWSSVEGYPTERKISGKAIHDGRYLYLRLNEQVQTASLKNADNLWEGDDWELFFAVARGKRPYYQLLVGPNGKHVEYRYDEGDIGLSGTWDSGAMVVSDVSDSNNWTVVIALPLDKLLRDPVSPGKSFYANIYRGVPRPDESLAWSPNPLPNFHDLGHMVEMMLE